uniref:Thioredoxin domain-containing protein n=1 Tax=Rhodosorus marinus TaxID=101924 RepID=A0A7S0G4N1_9RHOD|mmetsp:Transcript_25154/g.36252  ORF Transcript_25154/g.36252 Transcript_25154/m.36252 type:complete len:245 (+) Transcript_25154:233-967(+)
MDGIEATTSTKEEWLESRTKLLAKEIELTRLKDEVAQMRRELPLVEVEDYVFEAKDGPKKLSELFGANSQLIVQHFMFGPEWEEGCPSCSFWADGFDPMIIHVNHRDASFVACSRAPVEKLETFKERMGWKFEWVSALNNSFNYDFNVYFPKGRETDYPPIYNYKPMTGKYEELPGISTFYLDKDTGKVYHQYSSYARGLDILNSGYQLLDLLPKGRDEKDLHFGMEWVRRHDQYDVLKPVVSN